MVNASIDAIRSWNGWLGRRERHWKALFYTFAIAFILALLRADAPFVNVLIFSASLAFWVAVGFWLSDKLRRRLGGRRR